ncbi:MAG: spore germination protein GerW family protein [Coprothermobacterota bacterium]|nr:spore germination protein GerW family protein [Coprothermobacterota bacterium]
MMSEIVEPTLQPIERMLEKMSVDTVFGPPVKEGDLTLIPVAEYAVGFAFGNCSCPSGEKCCQPVDQDGEASELPVECKECNSGGGGGGGMGRVVPRGFIKISAEGASYEPIINPTRIAIALFAMIGWSAFWLTIGIRALVKARN